MTRSPSVTGVAEQYGLSRCVCSCSVYVGPDCQSCFPSARLKQITVRRLPTAWVTKTRSPQTLGEELPRSGKSTRQRTFSEVLQVCGRFSSDATPVPVGPRQPGQF